MTHPHNTSVGREARATDAARLDGELVRRGLARSRTHAARLVAAGRVEVAGRVVTKSSTTVSADVALDVRQDPQDPGFVSRGAHKLEGVLAALGADGPGVEGTDCLDVGASTGGFTEVLLRRGARQVIALDVGHGQLAPAVRDDERVHVIEGCNARDLTPDDLPWLPRLVVADVSFISLTMILPALARTLPGDVDLLLMIKPQFEVGRERLGSGGVVRDVRLHADAVRAVTASAAEHGLGTRALVPSPLPGPQGNREFFAWFTRAAAPRPPGGDTIDRAVAAVPEGTGTVVTWVDRPEPPTPGGRA